MDEHGFFQCPAQPAGIVPRADLRAGESVLKRRVQLLVRFLARRAFGSPASLTGCPFDDAPRDT
jgi:hypothetical protein